MTTGIARLVSDEVTTDDHRYSPFGGVLSKITVAELWYITRLVCQVRLLLVTVGITQLVRQVIFLSATACITHLV